MIFDRTAALIDTELGKTSGGEWYSRVGVNCMCVHVMCACACICARVCVLCVHVYEQYSKCFGHTLKLLDSSMISFYTFVQTYVKLQLSLAVLAQNRSATAVERRAVETELSLQETSSRKACP